MTLARGIVIGGDIPGLTGVALLTRERSVSNGQLITRASLLSIAYAVSDLTAGVSLGTGTFVVANVVYDALQQGDPRWQEDSASSPGSDGAWGYNFAGVIPAVTFPSPAPLAAPGVLTGPLIGRQVQVDVAFIPVIGEPWRRIFQWRQAATYG